ncbi:MAG: hypothetical protein ABIS36_18850 [Chryseolinea sp.]
MKVNSSLYKGIQYVQLNALPPDQQDKLLNTINPELFIKILVDGKLIRNCIQFKDYEYWFDNVFASRGMNFATQSLPAKSIKIPSLAFKKN